MRGGRGPSTVSSVSPLREICIILLRELRKSFRSVKGILLLIFTMLAGGGLALLLAQSDEVRKRQISERLQDQHVSYEEAALTVKRQLLSWWFADAGVGAHLAAAPFLLVVLFTVSLVMIPAVVLLLGFDSVSGELQHRAVRYWALRSRRWSYITGKFIGLWATCSIVALAMHLLIWIVIVARGEAPLSETISWGVRFWLASLPIIAVWCSVSILFSGIFKHPILALLLTSGVFFVWWFIHVPAWVSTFSNSPPDGPVLPIPSKVLYSFPNFYDRFLLSPLLSQTLIGLAVTLGFAALCIAGSSAIFAKRDL